MGDNVQQTKAKKRKAVIDSDDEDIMNGSTNNGIKEVVTKTHDEPLERKVSDRPPTKDTAAKVDQPKPAEQSKTNGNSGDQKKDEKKVDPAKPAQNKDTKADKPDAKKDAVAPKKDVKKETKPAPKVEAKKVKQDSEFEDEDDDEDNEDADDDSDSPSDSEESDYEETSKKKAPAKKSTPSPAKKKKGTPEKSQKSKEPAKSKAPSNPPMKTKDALVYDVLKRWWYALPDWPPKDFDYGPGLEKNNLRKVDMKHWKIELEEKEGKKKVHEIPSYNGLFKDTKGEIIDLRPSETCPSYENFKRKSPAELSRLLVTALKGQIQQLQESEYVDQVLLKDLQKQLAKAEHLCDSYNKKK